MNFFVFVFGIKLISDCLIIGLLLNLGKSGIHGFGIFTKQPHRAGDMVG